MNIWDWYQQQPESNLCPDIIGIDISNVMKFYWEHEQQIWDFQKDFPNIAPPFRTMFMWGKLPGWDHIEEQGTLLHAQGDRISGWTMTSASWLKQSSEVKPIPTLLTWKVTPSGGFDEPVKGKGVTIIKNNDLVSDEFAYETPTILHAPMLALSLMHCKNVSLKSHVLPPALVRKRLRKHLPPRFNYKVLEISPMTKVLKTEGKLGTNSLSQALHICRGHFKDYRHGGGLFGKNKGLYWWDTTVRGKVDNGVIIKDYKLKEGKL